MNRLSLAAALALVLAAPVAQADRITAMSRTDLCAYNARMQVLAAHYAGKGMPRDQVQIHWHGDETENEIAHVNRQLDEGYAAWARERARLGDGLPLELFGDGVFERCMRESDS